MTNATEENMKRAMAWVGVGTVIGGALCLAPVVLGGERSEPADAATVTKAEETAAAVAIAHTPEGAIDPPTPSAAGPGGYNPMQSFAPLVTSVAPAVLQIEVDGMMPAPDLSELPPMFRDYLGKGAGPQEMHGEGSGFIISADGYVLTNNHVVEHADKVQARFADGSLVDAKVVGTDPDLDLAVLQLDGHRVWPFVALGSSGDLDVGDWVVAMGNPLGLGTTVTAGIVSGKGRALGHDAWDDFIQTDAAINEGNSGGPLFDLNGRVVGINTAIIAGANTIGFAVPIDLAKSVIDDLEQNGHVARGFIGVQSAPAEGHAKGARIAEVYDGTPASKAGLTAGDVIVGVDQAVIDDPSALVRAIGSHDPGDHVVVQVLRKGKPLDVDLTLAERPAEGKGPTSAPSSSGGTPDAGPPHLGIGLESLPGAQAKELGVDGGVVIGEVEPGSAADGYLRPGDVILEVNHWPVTNPADVAQLVASSGDSVLLRIVRDGQPKNVAVALP
jgi:serine protease Do